MKNRIAALLLAFAWSAHAQESRVALPDTPVTFEVPASFTVLSKEEIAAKYPAQGGPSFVIGNERRTTTIAGHWTDNPIAPEMLAAGWTTIGDGMARIVRGHQWVDRKLVQLAGQQWAYFEMTSSAVDSDIHNIVLMTSLQGRLLVINFNSTKADFPQLEPVLRASIDSIELGGD